MAQETSKGKAASNLSQRDILEILEGNLLLEHCPYFRNVRIFLSSGYADCKYERKVLHKKAFPALRAYCESLGFQFYLVDLFWGLGVDAAPQAEDAAALTKLERDGLYQLAIKEIKLCQLTSMGPNFVTLLAQSYGHRPLCTHIEEDDFKVMCASLEDPARELLCQWYRRNNNSQPPGYVLLRHQEPAEKEPWSVTHEALSKAIRRAAKVALSKDPARVQKYLMSALEKEVIAGIFSIKTNPNDGCYWIKRTFSDLYEQRGNDPALSTYADLTPGKRGLEFDVETIRSLNHLKEARMCAKYVGLESENIFEFQLKWQKNRGLDPEHNPSHSAYLESLCKRLTSGLERRIGDMAAFMSVLDVNRTYQEVLHHGAYCRSQGTSCLDRSSLSARIQTYLDGGVDSPLVIHGPVGSGKTTVMAAAAYRLRERSVLTKRIIVVRFLGTTPSSSSIRQTLRSICEQLSIVYKEDPLDIPADYRGIVDHFSRLLHKASSARPICIFLDAVDLLSPEDGALGMSWLPSSLPPHVRFVLSTSSEAQYGCYPVLCGLLCGHKDCFLEVPRLSTAECEEFLTHHTSCLHVQLTPHQHQVVVQSLLLCPLPLYLQLLVREAGGWTSDTHVSTESFPPAASIEGMIKHLFEQAECDHPVAMVSHSLGYVTAAQYGLSESELLDILACDEQVTSELQAPPTPLQWAQLYHGLAPFLQVGVGVGGAAVLRWGHRKVREVARSRYLGDEETTHARFQLLADYFSGMTKCQVCAHGDECPHINHQPLVLGTQGEQGCGWRGRRYNGRKLRELPYCLARCGRTRELTDLLVDFRWIQACILTTSCGDMANDFAHVIPVVPLGRNGRGTMYRDVRLLSEALALSSDGLNADPDHLCTQLLGRLLPYATPSGENRLLLKSILQQAIEDTRPVLVPTNPFFRIPGGPLLASMEGHRGAVSCITSSLTSPSDRGGVASMALFSSSWDNSLKSWDLGTVGVAKTFDGHTDRVLCVASSADGRHVVSGSRDRSVRYWEACTGQGLATMRGHTAEVNTVVMTTDGNKVASGSADSTIMVWNVDRQSSTFGQLVFTMKPLKSSLLSMALSHDDRHLAAGAQDGTVMIMDIVSGEVLATLKEQGPSTAVALMQLEKSNLLIAGSGYGGIKVWDFPSGEPMHSLAQGGKEKYAVTSVSAGPNGRLVTVSNKIVSLWDLKTGQHLYDLTDCTDVMCVHVADEGRLLVTGSEDHRVRIWDLETPPIPQTTKVGSGNMRAVSVSPCGGYCAVGGEGGVVVVCELDTLKAVQRLEEEAHSGSVNHIVVLRDARTVITAAEDGLLRSWDGEEGKCLQVFGASGGTAATCVAVSHDGTLIMSGDRAGKVVMWSAKSGKNLRSFADHKQAVVGVGFARGNAHHQMVSASADGVLCLRDFVSGKMVGESRLHKEELLCLALSPDSNFLVTGSRDRSAQVVPLPGGLPSVVMSGHKGAVTCIEVFSDCETCLTGSEDRTLRVWSTSSGRCLSSMFVDDVPLACAVGRNFTVLYGSRHGWVSTATYLSGGGGARDVLQKKLLQGDALMDDVDEFDGTTSECSVKMVSPSPPLEAFQAVPLVSRATVPIKNENAVKEEQPLESDEPAKKKRSKPLKKEQKLEGGEPLQNERPLESEDHDREVLKENAELPHRSDHVEQERESMYLGGGSERELGGGTERGLGGSTVHQQQKEQSYKTTTTTLGGANS